MSFSIIKTFTFLDESGVLGPSESSRRSFYGIGALKHVSPNQLIQRLHPVFEGLCAALKKEETRVEFSFKSTTASSVGYDLKFLDVLKLDDDWEFNCLFFDVNDSSYRKPSSPVEKWDYYVSYSKMLIKNNLWAPEETVVIADYQRQPGSSRKKFEFIAVDIPQVYNVLQLESHGVLLIQVVDMLLGVFLYSLDESLGDKEGNKTRISRRVLKLKEEVGKERFNCWRVDWEKSRSGRV